MHFSQSFAAKLTAGLLAVTGMIAPAFAVSGTVDAEGGLRLRNASSTDAAVLETIPDGSQIEVSGITESGWYQVSFQDTQGYVSTDYVVLSETVELPTVAEPVYGKVTEGPLNVRSAPSTDSEKVDSFSTGKVLTILETLDGWYKVEEGYVSADYVTIIDAAEAASSGSASEVVDLAMQYLGYPYCYGGSSPSGFDCSGFVRYVYSQFGCSLNRTASAQMSNGTSVSMSELQPGDLVFFLKSGSGASRASHVGIYIGGGQFIHASTSSTGVIISDMDSAYYTTGFVGGRRILWFSSPTLYRTGRPGGACLSFFCLCIFSAFRAYCAQIRPAASAGRGGKEHIMNATVNSNCIGCGLCVSICPEVFEIGDDGLAQPIQEVTETLEKTASQARESCPVNAIDLE